jgi:hypothetical protein
MKPMGLPLVCLIYVALVPAASAVRAEMDAQSEHVLGGAIRGQGFDRQSSATRLRLAQGSTGGTLGKTDQSLSGGQPKETPPEKAPGPKRPKQGAAQAAGMSVSGQWSAAGVCGAISWQDSFVLQPSSATNFTGRFVGPNTGGGTIVNGSINANQLSFDRVGLPLGMDQRWTARVEWSSGKGVQMQGSITGLATCTFTARKQ